ncbi:trihelix transcription factor GT-3a-like [Selaginella moellendorffii]|uniref:trihelix transcription factor GT-3a-like n=1 Tax=Selaginella moellendorffii TaxID=88036 RepID=UPI000D1D0688|nr:trihelix transcription factor GT-3a-like [Selaginella moellendorffii]|eukprot:XP_024521857.1 trihelix transcription factor GT-3a-like [Selaginella moellendorffii]
MAMAPGWGVANSRQLLCARAQLDYDFAASEGNAMREARLWDLVASRMSFQCSGRECEREWRALVSRYEEKGLQEGNASLFEEIDAIFKSRGKEAMVFTISEEESVSIDSHEDGESEAERDVQQVLEDMFHRMPCVPPGWLWQEGMMAKEKNGDTGLDDEEHHPALSSSAEASTQCKQEAVEERMPRWGHTETKDFISIRAGMEEDPSLSSQKNWWDRIAGKMRERGYARTSEQCKRKWKKLVSRYKEKRTTGLEHGRKFLFFPDMDELFKARLQRTETAEKGPKESLEENQADSDQLSEDADSAEVVEFPRKKRRTDGMHQVLSDFIAKQQAVERRWQELLQRKQREWQQREHEWMSGMEKLQQQRMAREAAWRDREEQRRAREEIRAQKWDKLFAVLADRLQADD